MIRNINAESSGTIELYEMLNERSRMEPEDVIQVVGEIISNIRKYGDTAIIEYMKRFDGVLLTPETMKVTEEEIKAAYEQIDESLFDVIRQAKNNIERYHRLQKDKSWMDAEQEGIVLGQLYRPLETVGVYVPNGSAPLPSSVLMNIIPARAAGVERIVMCTPPGQQGCNPAILVAAKEAGADEIYRLGGAQAIAAMAFGTDTIPRVDKICGPGNIYVATAKRMVFGYCGIDMFAGPSEITVVADETANPVYIAADMLSQAEHDKMASAILITTSDEIAEKTAIELERQLELLDRRDIAEEALKNYGVIVKVKDMELAMDIVNKIAPEHLELCVNEPFSYLGAVRNAGAVFLGSYSPEPLGDYFAGPNHVLPTSGTARFFSPLSVSDFVKKSSVISYSKEALLKAGHKVVCFAEAEGLGAHANAIKVRLKEGGVQ